MASATQTTLQTIRDELRASFFERTPVIDGVLTALVAGEHVLMLGPPGTAKSALASVLCKAIDDAQFFQWLLTKFSTPEELFGPMSLKGLEQDKFTRNVTGKLPLAHIAFLDEIFKANSSILNALLTIINEREFFNDGAASACPLLTMVGASNELPESKELEALFDRFLLRYWINYVGDRANVRSMLLASEPAISAKLTLADIAKAQAEAAKVKFSDASLDTLLDVKDATEREGVRASDRRWRRVIKALRAFAYLNGDNAVTEDHFDLLPDMLWREPSERTSLVQVVGRIANPLAAKAIEVTDAARELFASLPSGDVKKAEFLAAAADANAQFEQMKNEVNVLVQANPNKARKLREALSEIDKLHKDTQRRAAKAAGISI